MNKPQSPRRPRGRGPKRNNKGNGAGRGDNRARGNPRQSLEKYKTMARDALQTGDRVLAEYYLQHADHYQRVCNERFGVSSDEDIATEGDMADQDEQGQSRRPQRSRSQRADAASAAERAERATAQTDYAEQPAISDSADEAVVDSDAGKSDADAAPQARPNGRRRPAQRKTRAAAATDESVKTSEPSETADKEVAMTEAEDAPVKPRPRRRRKVVEEAADAAPE